MKQNNREKILETARQLLPRYGYNGISIRAIASKSKLTTGAIYFHFKNKKDIYRTICAEAIDRLIQRFREGVQRRETPGQKLISIFDSYIKFYNEERDYYNIIMEYKAAYEDPDSEDDALRQRFLELAGVTADTVKYGIGKKDFRNVDPVMVSLFLAAVTDGMLQYKKLGMFDALGITDAQFRSFMADVVAKGISYNKS